MVNDFNIDIDLKLKPSFPTILKINQYDRGICIKVNLFDNGEPYTIPSTETAIVELSLPQGKGYIISGDSIKDISNNSFRFAVDRNISLNSGEATFNVSLVDKKTGTTIRKGSFKRYIRIESNSIDEGTISSDLAVSVIETIQSNVATATAKETSLRETIKTGDLDNYVTKVSGKGLSTNDFTNAYKTVLDGLTTTINDAISTAIVNNNKATHPLHSTKITFDNVNPGTYITGTTWELTAKGKTLVGVDTEDSDFNAAGKTGGSKTHTHPSGSIVANIGAIADDLGKIGYVGTTPQVASYGMGVSGAAVTDVSTKKVNHATTTSGNTASASSLQPYITVYIWERTA